MLDSFYLDPNAVTGPDPLGILMVAVIAYFCGCFNGAVIVSKYILRDDVRNHGSGNAGLTNFYRTFGKKMAALTAVGDFGKGVVAVALGRIFFLLVDAVALLLFKRRVPEKYQAAVNTVGFVVLMGFMLLVTLQDVWKLIR